MTAPLAARLGGLGALEEILEIATWKYLGIHIKPLLLLNYEGYYDNLLRQFRRCEDEGLMREGLDGLWKVEPTIGGVFDIIDKILNR